MSEKKNLKRVLVPGLILAVGFDSTGEELVVNQDGSVVGPGLVLPQDNK